MPLVIYALNTNPVTEKMQNGSSSEIINSENKQIFCSVIWLPMVNV